MKTPVVILGGGGHVRVLIEILQLLDVEIVGITLPDGDNEHKELYGIKVIGTDESILKFDIKAIKLVNGLGSVGINHQRIELYQHFKKLGYSFAQIIHPTAILSPDISLGEGVQVMAGAIIQTGSQIGENVIINTKVSVDHDCNIGSHVHLAPGVTLSGGVKVASNTHIGTGAIVIQGVSIGESVLVAAGGVVINRIQDNVTVKGIPAK